MVTRGNWNEVWSVPIVLSLSMGQRRKAKAGEAAIKAGAGVEAGSEPDMFCEAGSVAAE